MTPSPEAVRDHAALVAADRLRRKSGALATLDPVRRHEVEQVAYAVAAALADCLLEEARKDPALAEALVSVYGERLHSSVG